jgi:U3 small nucleolar RNA-associated protein 11
MSSFKKAIPKRHYRERSQLSSRSHLGLLEKKQDYKQRADDAHKKEKKIAELREQALTKNPDEFYYAMENSRIVGGKHQKLFKEPDEKLKKKQKIIDGNLLNMKTQAKANKLNQLKNQLHLIDAPASNKHLVFVKDEKEVEEFDLAQHFNTIPELLGKTNLLTREQIEKFDLPVNQYEIPSGYVEFESQLKTEKKLRKSLEKNEFDKKFLNKDKYKLIDSDKNIYKWFRERKR